jgi:hypothetical protein
VSLHTPLDCFELRPGLKHVIIKIDFEFEILLLFSDFRGMR